MPIEELCRQLAQVTRDFRRGCGIDQGLTQVYRVDRSVVITLNEANHLLAQKIFYLLLIEFDVLAPAIDHDANLLRRVTQSVKDLQGAPGAADCMNLEGEHYQNLIGMIESRNGQRVKIVRRVDDDCIESLPQQLHNLVNMFGFDLLSTFSLDRRGEERYVL